MNIFLGILLGSLFGFVLQRIGAADPDMIINMLRLRNLHLMKTILAGIGTSSILLFIGLATGLLDEGHLGVKSMYWGVVIGGLILGVGWGISGFCPGTGVAAAGTGRFDSILFLLGGLAGAGFYMMMYGILENTVLMNPVLGGKTTLAQTDEYTAILTNVPGWSVAVVLGGILIGIAFVLPSQSETTDSTQI